MRIEGHQDGWRPQGRCGRPRGVTLYACLPSAGAFDFSRNLQGGVGAEGQSPRLLRAGCHLGEPSEAMGAHGCQGCWSPGTSQAPTQRERPAQAHVGSNEGDSSQKATSLMVPGTRGPLRAPERPRL